MRVTVDLDRCIMAGECVYNHPWLFAFDDDGYPQVQVADLTTEQQHKEANQARQVCPSGAIVVHAD
jgi:ferredoxin